MPSCDLCNEDAVKEVHYTSPAKTKYYTSVCDSCFSAYKKQLIDSKNLTYMGYYSFVKPKETASVQEIFKNNHL